MVSGSGAGRNKSRQRRSSFDHNFYGGGISVPGSQAWSGLADVDCSAWRPCTQQSSKIRLRAPEAASRQSCAARFHDKLSKRARHIVCDHLFDDRCSSRASLSFTDLGLLLHGCRGASDGPYRPEPDLSWCSFSNGYSRRLVHRYGLGHRLLGAGGLASASRPARIRRSDVTAIRKIPAVSLGA
jgi:hypothetical protein